MQFNIPLKTVLSAFALLQLAAGQPSPNYTSPLGVEIFNPTSSFDPTGTWSLMSRAGPTLYIAGMRGIHRLNNTLTEEVGYPRVRLAFDNMQYVAKLAGTNLTSCTRLVVYVTDMYRWRPLVNQVQAELWAELNSTTQGSVAYPPRSIIEVQRLNDDDIVEVEGTFWLGS